MLGAAKMVLDTGRHPGVLKVVSTPLAHMQAHAPCPRLGQRCQSCSRFRDFHHCGKSSHLPKSALACSGPAEPDVQRALPAIAASVVLGWATTPEGPPGTQDMVTSPAGTTIAGVYELEKAGVRQAFMTAVGAAAGRADELSS